MRKEDAHYVKLRGMAAKANAAQGIPEMIEIAIGKHFRENRGDKHKRNAANGWYRYGSRFHFLFMMVRRKQIQCFSCFADYTACKRWEDVPV